MGVYKVIQDIEAEDKLLGPLTLKQFIFALVGVLFYYLSFLVVTKHAAIFMILFLPPALIATFFAWPWSADQPTEIWALAKLRYFFKPRRRIWDQSGVKDLVTITAPKKVAEPMRTNGLSQHEVQSRLGALSSTIDSRGWAIKNVNINLATQQTGNGLDENSDRLVTASSFPQEVPNYEIQASDDILDEQNNPIAQQFDQMITAATKAHRQQLLDMMHQPHYSLPAPVAGTPVAADTAASASPERSKLWFLNRPAPLTKRRQSAKTKPTMTAATAANVPMAGAPTVEEAALARQLKAEQQRPNDFASRMKTVQPLGQATDDQAVVADTPVAAPTAAAPQPNPTNLQLATNNDLDVATLARQASKPAAAPKGDLHDDEVVISLH